MIEPTSFTASARSQSSKNRPPVKKTPVNRRRKPEVSSTRRPLEMMSTVSEETLELMKAAASNGSIPNGTLVRSKLTNLLVWKSPEHAADDPLLQSLVPALFSDELPVFQLPGEDLQQLLPPPPKEDKPLSRGGRNVLGEIQNGQMQKKLVVADSGEKKMGMMGSMKQQTGVGKHDKENATGTVVAAKKLNWQDQWEALKKAGQFCNFCKKNKEVREIYQSHDLKGPDGEVTCPVLKNCVCQCCGEQGHTIAYCPQNTSGTSILKMINHHNRL